MTLCRRRGVAIDLILDRPRENCSQFVFTTLPSGREGIFWQTRKVVTTARPGARIPGRRASGIRELVIVVDTRERYPYGFSKQPATTVRAALAAGDYAVRSEAGTPVAVVERKSLTDLAGALSNGTLVFELAKLTEMTRAAVVVEDRYGNLLKHAYTPAGFLPDMLARVRVRYPEIPIGFLETRPRRGVDVPLSRHRAGRVRVRATRRTADACRRAAADLRRPAGAEIIASRNQ